MPNTKSAERRMRSSERKRLRNHSVKSRVKTMEKNFLSSLASGNKEEASLALRRATSALDKAAKSGVIHSTGVNRKKSRLAARLNAAAA